MLEKARLSNSKFTLLRRQYIIHCLRSSREYINSKRLFAKLLQEMYTAFSLGERLIPSDIKGRLLKVLAQDSSLDTSRIKKDRSNRLAVQLFRFFFDYKVVRHSRKRFYEVMETYWSKELPVMEIIPSNILLTADGYPSFWKDVVWFTKHGVYIFSVT